MNPEEIIKKRDAIIKEQGEWTAHNIHLGNGVYTYPNDHPNFNERLRPGIHLKRILQIVADTIKKPLSECRVLDLASLEGLYAIEFAMQGVKEAVGIEGREPAVAKSNFAAEALGLKNVKFFQDDVRNLSVEKYGKFDVILCLGIWYHLDTPDLFHFMERMTETCDSLLIVDTHIAVRRDRTHKWKDTVFHGTNFIEHDPSATRQEKLKSAWASLDNDNSFWFTRPSLWNLLAMNGFTSVYSNHTPAFDDWEDRDTIVALKGEPVNVMSIPVEAKLNLTDEINRRGLHPSQVRQRTFTYRVLRKLGVVEES